MEKINSVFKLKNSLIAFIIVGIALFGTPKAYALSDLTDLNTLINESREYDGQTVLVQGEALLEALERKDFTWVNINDGTNAIGVVMSQTEADQIKMYGDFKQKGDTVKIEAVFNRSCIEHGGDMDLHFVRLIDIIPGEKTNHPISRNKLYFALITTVAMMISVAFYKMKMNK